MAIEAIAAAASGPDWSIAMPDATGVDALDGAGAVGQTSGAGSGFGDLLAGQIGNLQGLQTDAAAQSQALATGTAEDASSVVMAVEKAQLSMQLAATLRDKSLEAFQEVFRTTV
jgi:flagellar hook-basal body complex protein FliE